MLRYMLYSCFQADRSCCLYDVSRCGLVTNVTIARDMQGVPRGFCHVEFSNELEAQIALSLSGRASASLFGQHKQSSDSARCTGRAACMRLCRLEGSVAEAILLRALRAGAQAPS